MLHLNKLVSNILCNHESDANTRIIATGGASTNNTILQILSDIFNTPVYTQVCIYKFCFDLKFQFK